MKWRPTLFAALCWPQFLFADQILVLSGGVSPSNNHYSQYLQIRTLAEDLRNRYPALQPTILFGAGNRPGTPPLLADVHRIIHRDGIARRQMTVGAIAANTPATLENAFEFFNRPQLKSMSRDQRLFMFVSDHGIPFLYPDGKIDKSYSNNCIDMWNYRPQLRTGQVVEGPVTNRCLSKDRLGGFLTNQVGAGRVVFAMSQCYSGGFHMMSVKNIATYPSADPRICGFTSVPEDTIASGCTPDADGPSYQGYERSFTEQLTGIDVVTGKRLRPGRLLVQEAHREATIEDLTKDIPLSTSDFFLWKWALAISKNNFRPRNGNITAAQARAILETSVIGARQSDGAAYRAKEQFFKRSADALKPSPEMRAVLSADLNAHQRFERLAAENFRAAEIEFESYTTALEVSLASVRRAWHQYVLAGKSLLGPRERAIEAQVYNTPGADFRVIMSMALQGVTDPETASALSDYQARRDAYALDFAIESTNATLNETAGAIRDLKPQLKKREEDFLLTMKLHGHARRLLIYRQVLGAWRALEAMGDQKALADLQGLLDCENTALP